MDNKEYNSKLRYFMIEMPKVIEENVPGIQVFGRRIKSFIFTTDIALIKNNNADAVMAVYPFTSLSSINNAIIQAADMPVFCGVGGINIPSDRLLDIARQTEMAGAMGIVTNAHVEAETIARLQRTLDIPVIVTVVSEKEDIERKLESGADMFNVSGADSTCRIIEYIRERYPYVPIIATGGPNDESILETIKCGADAISFSPPANAEIFKMQMQMFRENLSKNK